ncbi:MAG: protein kinase domain-containing protein, partial [Gemmataceae bacterium]
DGNLHFIVMEYVDGSNLLDIVKKFGALDIGRAVSYAYQVAQSLDFAFRNGIIHRDVKPGNILIDRRGKARILDMGLARFYNDQNDLLTVKYDDKIVLGTADYVAPEQVANSHGVDIRADIYGLGATFYFLLAGHPPFPAGTVSQKLLWHRTKEPTAIKQLRPEIPDGLATIVTGMMAKDPNQRYQTPAEVAAALEPWIPANVKFPSPEEMPVLCAAILEMMDTGEQNAVDTQEMTEQPTNAPIPMLAAVSAGNASSPAMRSGPINKVGSNRPNTVSNPFGGSPQAPANPFGPSPGATGAARQSGTGNPFNAPPGPSSRQPIPSNPFGTPPAAGNPFAPNND